MERKVKEEQRIEREAREMFPDPNLTGNPLTYGKRIGYIAGATKEAERNKEDAIGFAEWLAPNGWVKLSSDDDRWGRQTAAVIRTTEQLYEIYINQKV